MPAIKRLPCEIGRYTVVQYIGAGSGAEVYRATLAGTMGFTKTVALKLLPAPPTGINARQVQALVNEARIGGRLQHPNLCEVYEFGCAEGYYYISMEYLDGVPLSRALRVARLHHRRIPPGLVLQVATQVCRGLDHAHSLVDEMGKVHPLVHRDLKPANLMLTLTDMVKVMDFGIAKSEFNLFQTSEGMTRGTPMYMSPEQVRGEMLGPPSDLFSLGAILHEMLTGERLFEPEEGESLIDLLERVSRARLDDRLDRIRAEHRVFHPLLTRCLQRDPRDRYTDAREILRALEDMRDRIAFGRSTAAFVTEVLAIEEAVRREREAARAGLPAMAFATSEAEVDEESGEFSQALGPRSIPAALPDGAAAWPPPGSLDDLPSMQVEVLDADEEVTDKAPSTPPGRGTGRR